MTDVVLYEVADRVATVTLNRPEARNALSAELRGALPEAIERADGDRDVDVVILTGADPAFCAGLDLKELGSGAHDVSAAAGGDRSEAGSDPEDPQAGDRRGERRRHHRRLRARPQLRLPDRVRAGPVRRHPLPGRHHAGLGPHGAARRGRRRAPGAGAVGHRQLPRCRHRARLGAGEPRRAARAAAPDVPEAGRRHRVQRPGRRPPHPADLRRGLADDRRRGLGPREPRERRLAPQRRRRCPTRSRPAARPSWSAAEPRPADPRCF